jgi:virginiamycin B lyase
MFRLSQSLALVLMTGLCAISLAAQPAPPPAKARKPMPQKPGVPEVQRPIGVLKPLQQFDVEGVPDWLAIDTEHVFVSNKPKNNVARMDPKSGKVLELIEVGDKPCSGLALGFGSLWVPNCGDGTVSRVDTKSGKVVATLETGVAHSEGCITASEDSIWMPSAPEGKMLRIDPDTNEAVAEIELPKGSFCAAYGEGYVWVTSTETNVLSKVDPKTNLIVETIKVGEKPRFLTVGFGAVWTLNQEDGSVSKIDPKTNKVEATIKVGVPGGGGDISAGEGAVWVTAFTVPISRIDPKTNKVVQQFIGPGGDAIRVGRGSIWLTNLRERNIWRLDPKTLDEL